MNNESLGFPFKESTGPTTVNGVRLDPPLVSSLQTSFINNQTIQVILLDQGLLSSLIG
jgi:hypothetical protein